MFFGFGNGRWTDGAPFNPETTFKPYPEKENPENADGAAGCGLPVLTGTGENYFTLEECGKERKSICKMVLI